MKDERDAGGRPGPAAKDRRHGGVLRCEDTADSVFIRKSTVQHLTHTIVI